jgi:hypothetical protein
MVINAKGILYGTTASGGLNNTAPEACARYVEASLEPGCGVVFRLVPSENLTWNETVLYSFKGYPRDGSYPQGTLVMDTKGNLYGTTELGPLGGGTVFELSGTTYAEKLCSNSPTAGTAATYTLASLSITATKRSTALPTRVAAAPMARSLN